MFKRGREDAVPEGTVVDVVSRDFRTLTKTARLPSLNLFRVFESAAKHRSFTLAGKELRVTQSAVSQQVRQLEDLLGVRLFRRLPRRLELTKDGVVLAGSVQEALFMIGQACERLSDPSRPTVITVSATPSFAARWLLPRLKPFMALHANLRVTLIAADDPVNFDRQDVDLAIRRGGGPWLGVQAEALATDPVFPVCSPELLRELGQPSRSQDLERFTLLETATGLPWVEWCDKAGLVGFSFPSRLYFSDENLMLEAAAHGQGICLSSYFLVEQDIRQGRLAAVTGTTLEVQERYHILSPRQFPDTFPVELFRSWLVQEASRSITESGSLAEGGNRPPA